MIGRHQYFSRSGVPITFNEWARNFDEDRRVALEEISRIGLGRFTLREARTVSTVWLGLNHNFGRGDPLIFETMVFSGSGSDLDWHTNRQWRFSTERKAREFHQFAVRVYRWWWWTIGLLKLVARQRRFVVRTFTELNTRAKKIRSGAR